MRETDLLVAEPHEPRHLIIRHRDEAADPTPVAAVEPHQLLVLATPRAHKVPSLADDLADLLADSVDGVESVWIGVAGLAAATATLRRIADTLDVEVAAPDGGVVAMPGACLYAGQGAGGTGWFRVEPGGEPRFHGPRLPAPQWQTWLPDTAVGIATPAPCGLVIGDIAAFDVPVNPRFPKIVVAAPVPTPATVAEILGTLPEHPVMLVPAVPKALDHPWITTVADLLDRDVVFSAGRQVRTRAGTVATLVPDRRGRRRFRPFPLVLRQGPGDPVQQVLDIATPPPGWEPSGTSYTSGDVIADVVPSGLALRTADEEPARPAAPFDPNGWTMTVGTPNHEIPLSVLEAAEQLLSDLPPEQRAAATVRLAGIVTETGAHALNPTLRPPAPPPATAPAAPPVSSTPPVGSRESAEPLPASVPTPPEDPIPSTGPTQATSPTPSSPQSIPIGLTSSSGPAPLTGPTEATPPAKPTRPAQGTTEQADERPSAPASPVPEPTPPSPSPVPTVTSSVPVSVTSAPVGSVSPPPIVTTSGAPVSATSGDAPREPVARARALEVPVRASTAAEQSRFAAAAGEYFSEALATVNAAMATWPSMRVDESAGVKADFVAVCLFMGRGAGDAMSLNAAIGVGQAGDLDAQVACLMSGVRRLPTQRRAVLRQGKVGESLEHRSEPGTVLTEPGFLAASIDLDITVPGADLDVLIWPSTARRTSELIVGRPADEALFLAGARFKALAVRTAEDDDGEEDGEVVAPRIAVLYRELAPGEVSPTTDLDERDLAVLAKLDGVLERRHRHALRLVDDPGITTRLTTSMVVWQRETATAVAS